MNKKLGMVVVVMLACVAANAQSTVVSETEYRTACSYTVPLPLKTRAEGYRMTMTTKSEVEGRPSAGHTNRTVTSYQGPTKWHRVSETTFGSTLRTNEEISFGDKRYTRTGDGEWIEQLPDVRPPSKAPTKSQSRYLTIEYRLLPDESLNGRTVKVCEKYEIAAVKLEGSDAESRRESTIRYWIADEGMLKSENSYRYSSEKTTTTSLTKQEWEIDPTIRITPPAKFSQSK